MCAEREKKRKREEEKEFLENLHPQTINGFSLAPRFKLLYSI